MFGYLGTELGGFVKTLDQVIARIPKLPPWLSGLLPGIESSFFKGLVGMNPALGAFVGAASALPTVPVVPRASQATHHGPPPGYGGPVGHSVHSITPGRSHRPSPPARGGAGGAPPVTNHFTFNIQGADHKTTEQLGRHLAGMVEEHLSKSMKSSHLYGGLMPAGLEPDLWGAM